jgi:hypothetical protein
MTAKIAAKTPNHWRILIFNDGDLGLVNAFIQYGSTYLHPIILNQAMEPGSNRNGIQGIITTAIQYSQQDHLSLGSSKLPKISKE